MRLEERDRPLDVFDPILCAGNAVALVVEEGYTDRDGELPVNTSGGLKSKGHPLGASGVAQAVEIYEQLVGEAGPRQVEADVGLCCNVGGFGNCVITTIMEAAR
ncbi:thiolase C-terminal domain-containing protein [Natronococcus pandeyae]|uniref:thiolase C-terminal domain-containing protein n=1 Tax=Natronococcus pandeyae TaxID=2055836 RepID=UPI0037434A38